MCLDFESLIRSVYKLTHLPVTQVAFAEGYHAKEKTELDSKNTFSSRAFRLVFYLCLLWLAIQVIQVFSAVGGGGQTGVKFY